MAGGARISVVGLGHLGAPIAACFAARGFDVVGYDPVAEKVEALRERRALVHEPGLADTFEQAGDRLRATHDLGEAVLETDATFVVVPTPAAPDGSFALQHVIPTCADVGEVLREKDAYHLVALTSTVMPGTTERQIRKALEDTSRKKAGADFGLCTAALFVTVGNVVRDFLRPSMALVGEWDERSGAMLAEIYEATIENDAPVVRMGLANAELTKLALNVFVTMKITFANLLARVCELMPGGNVDVVTRAMEHDARIGHGALCGAIAYGGPFYERDNMALAAYLKRFAVAPELVGALGRFNRAQVPWLTDLVHERVTDGGRVGVLGLSYKPDTDMIEGSIGLALCEQLEERGVSVIAYDPIAMEEARAVLPASVELAPSNKDAVEGSDVVVITTPWDSFRNLPCDNWGRTEDDRRVVVDCWRIMPELAQCPRVDYVPLGIGPAVRNGAAPGSAPDGPRC